MLHLDRAALSAGDLEVLRFAVLRQVGFRHQCEEAVAVDALVADDLAFDADDGFFDAVDCALCDRGADSFLGAAAGFVVFVAAVGFREEGADLVAGEVDVGGCERGFVSDGWVGADEGEERGPLGLGDGHAVTSGRTEPLCRSARKRVEARVRESRWRIGRTTPRSTSTVRSRRSATR